MTRKLLLGNEAIGEGALRAGVRFFAGYPITPATEIAEFMARRLPAVDGTFIQMEDEIASVCAVVGASLTGAKAMTASSGPGLSLKQEGIGMAAMHEVPCVVVDVMRVGPATGMATLPAQQDVMQARWGTHGDRAAIALCPSSVSECFDLAVKAVNLSERFRTPVHLLADAEVGHMREVVDLPDEVETIERPRPTVPAGDPSFQPYAAGPDGVPPMADFGSGYLWHAEASTHNVRGDLASTDHAAAAALNRRLIDKVAAKAQEITFYSQRRLEDAEVVIVSYGVSARGAAEAVEMARAEGIKAGLLTLNTIWPFPAHLIEALMGTGEAGDEAATLRPQAAPPKAVLVAELNAGQVVIEVERAVRGRAPVHLVGRHDGRILAPADILTRIKEAL